MGGKIKMNLKEVGCEDDVTMQSSGAGAAINTVRVLIS
jgi:hypothetical protein